MNVWHGDKSMAMIRNNAGRYNNRYDIENMFDDDEDTFWFSDNENGSENKTITIDFFVSIIYITSKFFDKFHTFPKYYYRRFKIKVTLIRPKIVPKK